MKIICIVHTTVVATASSTNTTISTSVYCYDNYCISDNSNNNNNNNNSNNSNNNDR